MNPLRWPFLAFFAFLPAIKIMIREAELKWMRSCSMARKKAAESLFSSPCNVILQSFVISTPYEVQCSS